jgi:hypothetical protein
MNADERFWEAIWTVQDMIAISMVMRHFATTAIPALLKKSRTLWLQVPKLWTISISCQQWVA